jgi:phosphoadenosine phosphosulfate reductase
VDIKGKVDLAIQNLVDYTQQYQPAVFSTSLSAEDMVLLDLIVLAEIDVGVFTLDTGRLPPQTYDVLSKAQKKYKHPIQVLFPDAQEVEKFSFQHGVNSFYDSKERRKECCAIRKVKPLRRALAGKNLWITGLRSAQSVATRSHLELVSWDATNEIHKLNPLLDWSTEEIFAYAKSQDIPISDLYRQGYASIGCAPCTRPIQDGEDERAGRWWWEDVESKECGLHVDSQGRLVRISQARLRN